MVMAAPLDAAILSGRKALPVERLFTWPSLDLLPEVPALQSLHTRA